MKLLFKRISQFANLLHHFGVCNYLRYAFTLNTSVVKVQFRGKDIYVRRWTPDLRVALNCLTDEFEPLRYIYPKDYDGVIIDAGGYIGTAAIALAEIYPQAKIITIEPSAESFDILQKNIAGYQNITAINAALVADDRDSISLKNRGTGAWGFTVIQQPDDTPSATTLHEVPAVRLSALGVPLSEVGILKLDIEGGELSILENDAESLDKIDNMIVELHDRIVAGCSDAFLNFCKDRLVIKDKGEKYLAVRRSTK